MQNTDEQSLTLRKLVMGLRQVATDLVGRREEHESGLPHCADRISEYATELAHAIGYVEPSADMLAARELASNVVGRLATSDVRMVRLNGTASMLCIEAVQAIRLGEQDDCDIVQDMLLAIERGRSLAANGYRAERLRAHYAAPKRLTITIEGPRASGKTRVARWIIGKALGFTGLDPQVIEVGNDGRRFDVRNEEYLDHA